MLNIILLNGPAGSGKDTIANLLCQHYPGMRQEKFARPIRDAIRGFYGCSDEQLEVMKRIDDSTRQLMIGFSEKLVKPLLGEKYFATACAGRILTSSDPSHYNGWVISDCGFQNELEAFVKMVKTRGDGVRFLLVQVVRPFHIFDVNDSRQEVYLDPSIGDTVGVLNAGSIEDLKFLIERDGLGMNLDAVLPR